MAICWSCGTEAPAGTQIYRTSTCATCSKDLKVCYNCRYYAPGAHWDCSETIDEPVREKDRANFCTFFSAAERPVAGVPDGKTEMNKSKEARSRLDKLFGNE